MNQPAEPNADHRNGLIDTAREVAQSVPLPEGYILSVYDHPGMPTLPPGIALDIHCPGFDGPEGRIHIIGWREAITMSTAELTQFVTEEIDLMLHSFELGNPIP